MAVIRMVLCGLLCVPICCVCISDKMSEFDGLKHPRGMITFQLNGLHTLSPRIVERQLSYNDALLYCQFLDYGGYKSWRLPTVDELVSASYLSYAELTYGFYWAIDYAGNPAGVMLPSGTKEFNTKPDRMLKRVIRPVCRTEQIYNI